MKVESIRENLSDLRLTFLSMFIKVSRQRIVFDVSSMNMLDFLEPVMRELPSSKYSISAPYGLRKELSARGFRVTSFKFLRFNRSCKVFISASIFSVGPRKAEKVFLSHGYPVKFSHFPRRFLENFNTYLVLGLRHKDWIIQNLERVQLDPSRFKMIDLGFPRLELLSQSLSQNQSAQNFLFAPSWEPELRNQEYDRKLFESLAVIAPANNLKIFIRLHPVSLSNQLKTSDTLQELVVEFATRLPCHFIDVTDVPLEQLIDNFSFAITDWSGIGLEMLYLKKKLISMPVNDVTAFYSQLYGEDQGSTDELLLDALRNGGRDYSEKINLSNEISQIAQDLVSYRNTPQRYDFPADEYFSNPLNSSSRIAHYLSCAAFPS